MESYRLESNPDIKIDLEANLAELVGIENHLVEKLMRVARDIGAVSAAVVTARRGDGV